MKPEEQRIAIAEACGWRGFENTDNPEFLIGVEPQNEITEKALGPRKITNWTPRTDVPDYLNDLNAMAEAENILGRTAQRGEYALELSNVITGCRDFIQWPAVSATAAQRAEAFLRVVNKWTDK